MDAGRFILICLAGWMNRNQQHVIEYLVEEVRVLKEHLEAKQNKTRHHRGTERERQKEKERERMRDR